MLFGNEIRMTIIIANTAMVIITVCHTSHNPLTVANNFTSQLSYKKEASPNKLLALLFQKWQSNSTTKPLLLLFDSYQKL
jgi:hypothetical protein